MKAVYILGLLVYIQNVYPFETMLIDVFKVCETWIFIHGTQPMSLRLVSADLITAIFYCYGWESYEVSWFLVKMVAGWFGQNFVYSTASWLGSELPSDSLIGDVGQGAVCASWSSYFMWVNGVPTNYLWHYRTWKQKLWRIFLTILESHAAVISIIFLVMDPSKKIYYSNVSEWWDLGLNLIPIGWFVYLVVKILFTLYLKWEDQVFAMKRGDYTIMRAIGQYYNCTLIFIMIEAVFCTASFIFTIPTYLTYYIGQVVLLILFYYYHRDLRSTKSWKTFLPYIHNSLDPEIGEYIVRKTTPSPA